MILVHLGDLSVSQLAQLRHGFLVRLAGLYQGYFRSYCLHPIDQLLGHLRPLKSICHTEAQPAEMYHRLQLGGTG